MDVFGADPTHGTRSLEAARRCLRDGRITACDVVWAEVAAFFPSTGAASDAMERLGVEFDPMTAAAALQASESWRKYRERGGRRDRVIPDFLIGAHALAQADRLLSRDRGFFRTYFARLRLLDPSA